jgi:integrase
MCWHDINWDLEVWNIPMTKNGDPLTVPLIPCTIEVLKSRKILLRDSATKWVFPSDSGNNRHLVDIKRSWHSLLDVAGIKNFHFHDIRHTCASYQAIHGVVLPIIGATLGHKSMQSTQRYAQIPDDPRLKAMLLGGASIYEKITGN